MKSPGGKAENWRKGLQLHHAVKINHTLMTEPSPGPARLRLRGRLVIPGKCRLGDERTPDARFWGGEAFCRPLRCCIAINAP